MRDREGAGSFTLTANATSTTSIIAKVEFYNGATCWYGHDCAIQLYLEQRAAGTYSITAKATDTLNATTISAP